MKHALGNNSFTPYMKVGDEYDFICKGQHIGSCEVLAKDTVNVMVELDSVAEKAYLVHGEMLFSMMVPRGHLNVASARTAPSSYASVICPRCGVNHANMERTTCTYYEDMRMAVTRTVVSHNTIPNYITCPYCGTSHHFMVVHTCPQKTESKILDVPAPKIFSPPTPEKSDKQLTLDDLKKRHGRNVWCLIPSDKPRWGIVDARRGIVVLGESHILSFEYYGEWKAFDTDEAASTSDFPDMSNRDIELEIFRCSGILNESIKLANAKLRNGIVGKVGEYRQALRMELHGREQDESWSKWSEGK